MSTSSFDGVMEKIGYGRFQKKLLWICGFGWAADAMEVMLISFALPSMSQEWALTASQKGLLSTAIFAGMLIGAIFWGSLSDKIGRKLGFVLTIAFDSLFGLASAFAPNFTIFLILRILTGFGVGGTLPVDYGMFSEFLPAKDRGKHLVLLESFWAFGTIAAAGLAWLVVPLLGWRALFAVSALPGLILFVVRRSVPESPRFLAGKGKEEMAHAVLEKVANENGLNNYSEVKNLATTNKEPSTEKVKKYTTKDLFSKDLLLTTILLWFIWFTISIGYYGAFTWLPSWLRNKGIALPSVYPYSFITALFQLPGYFSAAYFVEKIGRRKTLGIYLLGSGLCAILFAFAEGLIAVMAASAAMSFFALGAWGALYAYTPEAYPTEIRTTGIGAASSLTRLAGIVGPSFGAIAASASGLGGNELLLPMLVFAIAFALGGISSFILPKETMGVTIN